VLRAGGHRRSAGDPIALKHDGSEWSDIRLTVLGVAIVFLTDLLAVWVLRRSADCSWTPGGAIHWWKPADIVLGRFGKGASALVVRVRTAVSE